MAVYLGIANDGTFVTSDGYSLKDANDLSLYGMPASDKLKIVLNGVVYRTNINLTQKEAE